MKKSYSSLCALGHYSSGTFLAKSPLRITTDTIQNQEQKRVFERFYRVTYSGVQGLGLGLYLSQQVASLHNGKIWVKSVSGKRSTLYLQMHTG